MSALDALLGRSLDDIIAAKTKPAARAKKAAPRREEREPRNVKASSKRDVGINVSRGRVNVSQAASTIRVTKAFRPSGNSAAERNGNARRQERRDDVRRNDMDLGDSDGQWSHDLFRGGQNAQFAGARGGVPMVAVPASALPGLFGGNAPITTGASSRSQAANGPRPPVHTGTTVMVTNLDKSIRSEDLMDIFKRAGEIKSIAMHFSADGSPKGSCDIVFRRRADAEAAVAGFDGRQVDDSVIRVRIIGDNVPVSAASVAASSAESAGVHALPGGMVAVPASLFSASSANIGGMIQRGRGFGDRQQPQERGGRDEPSFRVTISGPPPASESAGSSSSSSGNVRGRGGSSGNGGRDRGQSRPQQQQQQRNDRGRGERSGGRGSGSGSGSGGRKPQEAGAPSSAMDLDSQLEAYIRGGK